ncbi:hypothetical protein Y88_3205 [Novosphingobium nitrogenifigens DSM 19370]|uniref:Uncharacterized protein n=1 Tax=Novosphingobium nitrogenifigens DSM 19370 TaxID=983920 RepID=F1ZBP0_9SPHN|nr:hypothetical protein [Novosphingobium nitrogenifigens]EGD57875.1 hypothetical protein Y88_3205 [Novosphingobium nitrogenifigens DSM 19370]
MKEFFRNVSPRRAILDLWQVLGAPSEYRWTGMVLAATVTGSIFWLMIHQEGRALPPPPKVIYFESWRANRSDAEIIAGNIAAARKAKAEAAEEERRAEDIRKMYKAVGAATGLDTDKMYKDGNAERSAEEKAEFNRNKALLDRYMEKGAKPVIDPSPAAGN